MTAPEKPGRRSGRRASGRDLDRAIVGAPPVFTAPEAAAVSGVDPAVARRLWRAFGFPEYGDAVAFSQPDVLALDTLVGTVEAGSIDLDTAVNLTRALGQTMARLADWQVATLLTRVEELARERAEREDAESGRIDAAMTLLGELEGPFEDLMIYAWRRHLAAAAARTAALNAVPGAEDDAGSGRIGRLTVGFADMVAFTSLSNSLREDRIGDLVEVFESRCADVVAGKSGRIIKSLGDSVLFVNDDPVRAVETAEGIIAMIGRDSRMPEVRLGLATGPVVMRLGDVFGPPVNLAARLTAVARRNRVIIDAATAELLPGEEFETRRLPGRPVRGFGIVEPLAVRRH
jgi:adenylate cyclase